MMRKRNKQKDQLIYVDGFSYNTTTKKYEFKSVDSHDLQRITRKKVEGRNSDVLFLGDDEVITLHNRIERYRRAQKKEKTKQYGTIEIEEPRNIFKSKQLYYSLPSSDGKHDEVPTTLMTLEDYSSQKGVVVNGEYLSVVTGKVLNQRYRNRFKQKKYSQLKETSKELQTASEAKSKAQPEVKAEVPVTKPQPTQKAEEYRVKPQAKRKTKRKAKDDLDTTKQPKLIDMVAGKRLILFHNLSTAIPLFQQHKLGCIQLIQFGSIDDIITHLRRVLDLLYKSAKEINDSIDEYNYLSNLLGLSGGDFIKVTADNYPPVPSPVVLTTPPVTVEAKPVSTPNHEPELLSTEEAGKLAKLSEEIESIINTPSQIQASQNPYAFFSTYNDFTAMCITKDSIPSKIQQP